MQSHQITTFARAFEFLLAGNATFTLVSEKTGARFTYRIRASKDKAVHFVSVLSGPDNESSYSYMGIVKDNVFRRTAKSKISEEAPSHKAFAWFFFKLIEKATMPVGVALFHEGRCGRCNRVLTVPESIETGLGPECSSVMGVHRVTSDELGEIIAARKETDEQAMQRMEAEGDRAQTIRDEQNKMAARDAMERT